MTTAIISEDIYRVYPRAEHNEAVMEAAVLDIALDRVLHAMHRHRLFEIHRLTFKGGTALRKFHLGHEARFSFDLDFNIDGDREAEHAALAHMGSVLAGLTAGDIALAIAPGPGGRLLVTTDLLPAGYMRARVDFFRGRPLLPTSDMAPLPSPMYDYGWGDGSFTVPIIHLEENLAEKMGRWLTRPVTRDLADLALLMPRVTDLDRLAEFFALRRYLVRARTDPGRRALRPAATLSDTLRTRTAANLSLKAIVLPSAPTDSEKFEMITGWLDALREPFRRLDARIHAEDMQRFSNVTDARRLDDARARLDEIAARAEPTQPPIIRPDQGPTLAL